MVVGRKPVALRQVHAVPAFGTFVLSADEHLVAALAEHFSHARYFFPLRCLAMPVGGTDLNSIERVFTTCS